MTDDSDRSSILTLRNVENVVSCDLIDKDRRCRKRSIDHIRMRCNPCTADARIGRRHTRIDLAVTVSNDICCGYIDTETSVINTQVLGISIAVDRQCDLISRFSS